MRRRPVTIPVMLTALRETVRERIELGEGFERIEAEVVDPAPLDEERRAALWLYAWCRAQESGFERRRAGRGPVRTLLLPG